MKKFIALCLTALIFIHAPIQIVHASQTDKTVVPDATHINYNHFVAPVASLVVGIQQGGKKGAVIGLLIGCVDEALVNFGLTSQHYLTAGLLGSGATSSIEWPWAKYLGFAGGSLVATGTLNPIIDKAGLPLSAALVGASQGGLSGGALGAVCGTMDQLLLSNNFTERPYLSNVIYGVALSSALSPHVATLSSKIPVVQALLPILSASSLPLKETAGIALGSYLSIKEPTFKTTSPIQLKAELHELLSRIVDKKVLDEIVERQAIVLVATQLTLANLGIALSKHFHTMDTSFAGLGSVVSAADRTLAYNNFNDALSRLVIFYPFNFVVDTFSNFVGSALLERSSRQIKDSMFETFSSGEVALRLNSDQEASILVEKMDSYLGTVISSGNVLGEALKSGVDGVFYVSFLNKAHALDLIVVLDIYNGVMTFAQTSLANWISNTEQSLLQVSSREQNLLRDILKEPNLLIPGDKMDLVKDKVRDARHEVRAASEKMQALSSLQNTYQTMKHVLGYLCKYYLIGSKIIEQKLQFADSQPALQAVVSVSNAMSWQSNNAQPIERIKVAMTSLHQLLDKFEESTPPELSANYKFGVSPRVGIRFDDVSVGIGDVPLVQVSDLYLESGIYAVTGAQGCGKSAFLSKVKGIQGNQFWAKGAITYLTAEGLPPKKMLITQRDYLTPYSTLLEIIMSKSMKEIDVAEVKPRVLALLKEIDFDSTGDDAKIEQWLTQEQADWSKLSGGQRKTIAIVSAIMAKPELLILDEVFAGMDKQSLANAQSVIRRELPNRLIFVVDHHAYDNNNNNFYDKEMHFADKQVHMRDLPTANASSH